MHRPSQRTVIALAILIAAGSVAPLMAPFDPAAQLDIVGLKNHAPSAAHWLGTDGFSRDVLSRALYGARTTVLVASLASVMALTMGAVWAMCAMALGSRAGAVLLSAADVFRSIPRLLLLLAVVVVAGALAPVTLAIAVGITASPSVCRVVYAQLQQLSARPFVEAASALGVSRHRVLSRHLVPHLTGPLIAVGVLLMADVMAFESAVSFLGMGVRAPSVSWGSMVQDAMPFFGTAWWGVAVPCTFLAITVLCTARVADRLEFARGRDHE